MPAFDKGIPPVPHGQVRVHCRRAVHPFNGTDASLWFLTLSCHSCSGLMEKDEWENLGLQGVDVTMSPEVAERARAKAHAQSQAQQPQSQGLPQQEAKR